MADPLLPPLIETERLVVRKPDLADVPILCEAINESLNELRPWMPWANDPVTLDGMRTNLTEAIEKYERREDYRLHIFRKSDDTLIGCSGMHRHDWSVPRVEIGYWCRTSCVGHGYITEAVRGIADAAMIGMGVERVEIRMSTENVRSMAVAERAGFLREAILHRNERNKDGSLRDTAVYVRLRA